MGVDSQPGTVGGDAELCYIYLVRRLQALQLVLYIVGVEMPMYKTTEDGCTSGASADWGSIQKCWTHAWVYLGVEP